MALHARRHPVWSPSGSQRAPSRAVGETMPLGRCRRVIACALGCLSSRNCWFCCKSAAKLAGARRFSAEPPYDYQPACKPGSVWPAARTADVTTIPLARRLPGASSNLPERQIRTDPGFLPSRSYSVLLPVGFAVPLPSPEARCALTAPFHPCRG